MQCWITIVQQQPSNHPTIEYHPSNQQNHNRITIESQQNHPLQPIHKISQDLMKRRSDPYPTTISPVFSFRKASFATAGRATSTASPTTRPCVWRTPAAKRARRTCSRGTRRRSWASWSTRESRCPWPCWGRQPPPINAS